jgi:hypothetical protein
MLSIKNNKYCFKYITLFSLSQQNFTHLTHGLLFEKKDNFPNLKLVVHNTRFP